MLKLFFISLINLILFQSLFAQNSFVENCPGIWKGTMYIYNSGSVKDSIDVKLTVAKTAITGEWKWKTEYLSDKLPIVKDYVLRLKDKEKNIYVIDEGDSVELYNYLFGNKLYCVFETEGIMLTSIYELKGEELVFEVTSGKKLPAINESVSNFSVNNLQRVVFRKIE